MKDYHVIVFLGRLIGPTYYAEQFLAFAQKHNIDCYIVNVNDEKTYNSEAFDLFAAQPNTVVLTFNNIGVHLLSESGNNFWKEKNIPVFDYIVDHPRNFADSMLIPPCDLYVFALDKDHVEYIKQYYKDLKGVYFSPNGGTEVNSSLPFKDREIDVLYMGNCQKKKDAFPAVECFEDGGVDFFSWCITNLVLNPMSATEHIIDSYFSEKKIDASDQAIYDLKRDYSGYIESTVRRYYKLEGMKALDDEGVHVDIYGNSDWIDDEYPFSDNIVLHERIGREELMEIIGHAKISLCFIPWFKRGCSEKNFDSMLNGALCVTDRSEYLNTNYRDGENIIFFDLNNPKQMAADVKWLLSHPDKASAIAHKGYKTAKKYDTWMERFEYVWSVIRNEV